MPLKPVAIVPQDLVLVHIDHTPAFFARVEDINPDIKRNWWQVTLFILALPMKIVTWTIDDDQIRGAEFTMGGTSVLIEKVSPPARVSEETESVSAEVSPARVHPIEQKQARILAFKKVVE